MKHALASRADAKPYGDVAYADPGHQADGKARYPIDSPDHVRAAWSYINMPKNAGKYSAEQLAAIKSRIKAAGRKYGIDFSDGSGRSRAGLDVCVRSFGFAPTETRDSDGRTLEGYAAVFNSPTTIRDLNGDFKETILPGAFGRTLRERTPLLQWDHGKDPRIGTAPIGDIEDLREDGHGLYVRARLYDHPDVERIRLAIKGHSVKGMSFRFAVPDGGDDWPTRDARNIRDLDAYELGPVAFPAYDTTSVSVRSLLAQLDPDEHRSLIRELLAELRAADLDLTGRPVARSAGGGGCTTAPTPHYRQRLDDGALRSRGIIK